MQPLAMAAVLLMALLPGVGRITQGVLQAQQAEAALHAQIDTALRAFCTQQGLSWQDMQARVEDARANHHRHPDLPASPHHQEGGDCGYCTLLAGVDLPPPARLPSACMSAQLAIAQSAQPRHQSPAVSGLGARGPPHLS